MVLNNVLLPSIRYKNINNQAIPNNVFHYFFSLYLLVILLATLCPFAWSGLFSINFSYLYMEKKKKSKNLLFSMSLRRCRFFVRHLVVLLVCIICVDVKFYFLFISFHFSLLSLGVYSCMLCVNFIFMTLTLTSLNKFIYTWKMKKYLSYNFPPI